MVKPLDFSQIQPLLTDSREIALVLAQKTNLDRIAAGLSLYLSLKQVKADANLAIFCSKPMTVEFSSLVAADQVKEKFEGKNLTISFDYQEGSVEKVSYNIKDNKFNLLIQPKEGIAPLSKESVEYRYFGQQPDLIFVVGARNWADLGEIYFQNRDIFEKGKVINFDKSPQNQHFGKVNLVLPEACSFSELVALMIATLNWPVNNDIASNLLAGLQSATEGFSLSKSSPMSFEAAAFCLRHGAGKPSLETTPASTKEEPPASLEPMPANVSAKKPIPPPDWLEPKIYKGNTLI